MIIKYIQVGILILLSLTSDIKTYKIKNELILFFILTGLATNFCLGGSRALIPSLLGCIIPVLLLIALFGLRMLGAGDIKLFCAIGAIMGIRFVLYTIGYSFIAGGFIALFIMIVRRNGRKRFVYFFNYAKSCIITFSLLPYSDFKEKSDGSKFHFTYAIMLGAIIEGIMGLYLQQ